MRDTHLSEQITNTCWSQAGDSRGDTGQAEEKTLMTSYFSL